MKILAIALVLISFPVFANELKVENYVKMQEALAKDDFTVALNVHKNLCQKDLAHHSEAYKDCKKNFKNIDQLRDSFKQLSILYIANAKKEELKGLMVAECPMAKAKWIQKEGSIANPYYGKSMLECGEKI